MNAAVLKMLERYDARSVDEHVRALREVFQELALLGLWRSKFFERAAFYGGTALRILHGLDRFSEDLDFSLLEPDPGFSLSRYIGALERELRAFGLTVTVAERPKARQSAVRSAFRKASTLEHLVAIGVESSATGGIPASQTIKIRLEVDTEPPGGFETRNQFLLRPQPFSVRSYALPDLFAGKMHAALFRRWRSRVKGRDWYDLVWFVAHHPQIRLGHLEHRMRQSGDWTSPDALDLPALRERYARVVEALDVRQAAREVEPFVGDPGSLAVWSREFFLEIGERIEAV